MKQILQKDTLIIIIIMLLFSNLSFSQTGCPMNAPVTCPTPLSDYAGDWELLFEDNFDGTSLDLTKWNAFTGVPYDPHHNYEDEWYTPNNITVAGGILTLEAKNEVLINQCFTIWENNALNTYCQNFNYTSGYITSKYTFGYGKYEIRCKIPHGQGPWPAFWAFGGSSTPSTEIDCFEFTDGNTSDQLTNVHSGGNTYCGGDYNDGTDFASDFHTFSVIWSAAGYVEWYLGDVNPVLIRRIDNYVPMNAYEYYIITGQDLPDPPPCSAVPAFPQANEMTIIANLAVQNNVNPTAFPCSLEIDYIRYYQLRDCLDDANIYYGDHIPLNTTHYNSYTGNSMTVGDISITTREQLKLAACDEIAFVDGFASATGSNFEATIDSRVCCSPGHRLANNGNTKSITTTGLEAMPLAIKSLTDNNFKDKIAIIPNPNNGMFTLDYPPQNTPGQLSFSIFDMQGNVIMQETPYNIGDKINMADLENGVYNVCIKSSSSTILSANKKLIITK